MLLNAPEATTAAQKNLLLYKARLPETIVNVRGRERHYSIDSHGFKYLKHHSQYSVAELYNTQIVQEHYLAKCQAVLKDSLNDINRVHVFNWKVRRF